MISGLPLYKVIFPDTDTVRPSYWEIHPIIKIEVLE
jgi:hypothetical protein